LLFEERYIQTHSMNTNSDVVDNGFNNHQFRIRYRAQANIPINHKKIEAKTYYISVWDEIFMSWGKVVTYHKPDQNRFFAGPGYQFSKDLSVQAGYYYQMLVKANGARQESQRTSDAVAAHGTNRSRSCGAGALRLTFQGRRGGARKVTLVSRGRYAARLSGHASCGFSSP